MKLVGSISAFPASRRYCLCSVSFSRCAVTSSSAAQPLEPLLMFKIVETRIVGLNIKQFVIEAPRVARKQQPGQFLILRLHEKGERIPHHQEF